jgi:type VI protein secretion system component VasK
VTLTRFAIALGVLLIVAFAVVMAIAVGGAFTPVVAFAALFALIGGGNLLYGKHSHGAAAQARKRPAQEAQNRAIDEAQLEARRRREEARQTRRHRMPGRLRSDGDVTG